MGSKALPKSVDVYLSSCTRLPWETSCIRKSRKETPVCYVDRYLMARATSMGSHRSCRDASGHLDEDTWELFIEDEENVFNIHFTLKSKMVQNQSNTNNRVSVKTIASPSGASQQSQMSFSQSSLPNLPDLPQTSPMHGALTSKPRNSNAILSNNYNKSLINILPKSNIDSSSHNGNDKSKHSVSESFHDLVNLV